MPVDPGAGDAAEPTIAVGCASHPAIARTTSATRPVESILEVASTRSPMSARRGGGCRKVEAGAEAADGPAAINSAGTRTAPIAARRGAGRGGRMAEPPCRKRGPDRSGAHLGARLVGGNVRPDHERL